MVETQSPETYIGYSRAENFVSPGGAVKDEEPCLRSGRNPELDQWTSRGDWTTAKANTRR